MTTHQWDSSQPPIPDHVPVGLSTASVWPQPARAAFELAADLGFDGVEVMVWADAVSQDAAALRRLSEQYGVPILAVHAPCLLITQRVWSADPEERLRRAVVVASELGATTVVVHPPFRWQRRYAERFVDVVAELEETSGIALAVENMFPLRPPATFQRKGNKSNGLSAFAPSPDPTETGFAHYTLDLSHAAAAQDDVFGLLDRMGGGRLAHVHLTDGTGAARDEHLLPGKGTQPCAEVCAKLAADGFSGSVVLEVNTRKARTQPQRAALLSEALLFARKHLEPVDTQ